MKILCISHGSTLNGAERSFAEMLRALSFLGYELYVIFPEEGPLLDLCKPYIKGCSIIYQPWWSDKGLELPWKNRMRRIGQIFKYSNKVCSVIKKINPKIVISNTSVIPCGAIASKMMRVKHIWYLRELGKEDLGFNLIFGKQISFWMINKLSSKVFFNSFFLESHYKKYITEKKRFVLYQAVELSPDLTPNVLTRDSDCLTLIMVGRFAQGKGQLEVVQAVHKLEKDGEKINLLLVGSGNDSYSNRVKNYVETNGLSSSVTLVPFSKDVNSYYQQADISIVSSRCEAFGRITVESMKMGLPVVASNTGANVELIQDGLNGVLYQYGDVEDLAQKILVFHEKKKRNVCASYAKKWADEKFNIYNYSQGLKEIL